MTADRIMLIIAAAGMALVIAVLTFRVVVTVRKTTELRKRLQAQNADTGSDFSAVPAENETLAIVPGRSGLPMTVWLFYGAGKSEKFALRYGESPSARTEITFDENEISFAEQTGFDPRPITEWIKLNRECLVKFYSQEGYDETNLLADLRPLPPAEAE